MKPSQKVGKLLFHIDSNSLTKQNNNDNNCCMYVLVTLILFTNDNDTYMHVIAEFFFLTGQINNLQNKKFVSKSLDSFSMDIS